MDGISFFLSAFFVHLLKIPRQNQPADPKTRAPYSLAWKTGLRDFFSNPDIRFLILLVFLNNLLIAPYASLEVPILSGLLGGSADFYSWVSISGTAGILAGSLLFSESVRFLDEKRMLIVSFSSYPVFYFFILLFAKIAPANAVFLGMCLLNFFSSLLTIWLSLYVNAAFVKKISKASIGRGAAIFNAIATAVLPVLSILISLVVSQISLLAILPIWCILSIVVSFVVFASYPKPSRS